MSTAIKRAGARIPIAAGTAIVSYENLSGSSLYVLSVPSEKGWVRVRLGQIEMEDMCQQFLKLLDDMQGQ